MRPGGKSYWNRGKSGEARSRRWLTLCCATLLALAACSADKAKEMLETAEFEERQTNLPHAKQLYEDVIRLYPSSKEADIARTRLAALNRE